jgi:hypothetical protein
MQEDSGNRKIDPTGPARRSIADPSPRSLHFLPSKFSGASYRGCIPGLAPSFARSGPVCFLHRGAGPAVALRREV